MKTNSPRQTVFHKAAHRLLSSAGLIFAGAIIASSFLITLLLANPTFIGTQFAAVVTSRLVSLTNQDRSDEGLGTLTISPVLTAAAQAKADDMAAKGYFAHVSPDGRTSWSWFQAVNYRFSYAGENLAVDFGDSGDVNEAWLNSPTHRANIMNGHFTEIGIATAEGTYQGHKTVFVVQMFGTPQTASASQDSLSSNSLPSNPTQPALASAGESEKGVLGSSAVGTAAAQPTPAKASPSGTKAIAASEPTGSASVKAAPTVPDAGMQVSSAQAPKSASWAAFAGSPRNFLRDIYILFSLILGIALLLRTRLEFRLHHARHAFAVLFLVALMGGLFVVADHTVFVAPIIGSGASV